MAMQIAETVREIQHVPGPVGAPSRQSHNDLAKKELDWEPRVSLIDGMTATYRWINEQLLKQFKFSE